MDKLNGFVDFRRLRSGETYYAADMAEDDGGDLNPRICGYCANRNRDACPPCMEEGKFRHLEPVTLHDWELPPELPRMRDVVDWPASDRLAILWLVQRYREIKETTAL